MLSYCLNWRVAKTNKGNLINAFIEMCGDSDLSRVKELVSY